MSKRTFKIVECLKTFIVVLWLRTFKFVFWLGVAFFLSGHAFQLFGRVTAASEQAELDRQVGGETIPAWVGKSYGEDMVFVGAIAIAAAIAGHFLTTRRRRRETDAKDFSGQANSKIFDELGEKANAYFKDLRIPKFHR